jgi:hypothetical protein
MEARKKGNCSYVGFNEAILRNLAVLEKAISECEILADSFHSYQFSLSSKRDFDPEKKFQMNTTDGFLSPKSFSEAKQLAHLEEDTYR